MFDMILIDKRAEKLFSIWWFVVLTLVGGGIVIGMLSYSSADIDVRQIEADILNKKLFNCITEQGILINDFLRDDFDKRIFDECGLNKNIFDSTGFYLKIKGVRKNPIFKGDSSMEKDCEIQSIGGKAGKWTKCFRKNYVVIYYNSEIKKFEQAVVEILTASNQIGERQSVKEFSGGSSGGGGASE